MRKLAFLTIAVILVAMLAKCAGGDETPPVISDISVIGVTETRATITWTTDEPADRQVMYSTMPLYSSVVQPTLTPLDANLVISHNVITSGVSANASYYYMVISKDASGNEAVSGEYTFTTVSPDEIATFPDANLETVVRRAISKREGDIYQSDLEELVELDAWAKDITNLAGLEYCTSLTKLHLEDNQIGDLAPLQNLTSLTWLDLWDNQIGNISPLQNLASLKALSIDGNQISDISPLQNLDSLTLLQPGRNNISDISPLSKLSNLTELNLADN
jgi:Leucine-rich repeat (LRR) protein